MTKPLRKILMPVIAFSLLFGGTASTLAQSNVGATKQLSTAVNGAWRTKENRARDQYRHPFETLLFFGVKPDSNVIELIPSGKAYYTEILAPYLYKKGHLTILNFQRDSEDAGQQEKFAADPAHYGRITIATLPAPPAIDFGKENSADFFLTFRNVHNYAMGGRHADFFNNVFKVLKPGGILGIEDHRATEGKTFEEVKKSGYLPEAFVIAEAEKAGFKLVGSSPVNYNPKDTHDHPKGVWSLPPTYEEGETNREKYAAIGESDRFTLKFVKPK